MKESELLTYNNSGLTLNVALNYSGRWDIHRALLSIINEVQSKKITIDEINELIQTGSQQSYYTSAIENLISKGRLINYAYTAGYPWIDIDTIDELSAAKTVFRDFISSTTF